MSKRKKKIVRPNYVSKEQRAKQAPKKPIAKELKFGIIFCACALVLAIVLFAILYDDGSLPVKDGYAVTEGNALITNTGTTSSPKFYKLGEVQGVEGYTLDTENIDLSNKMKQYTYNADDPDAPVSQYYVTGTNVDWKGSAQSVNDSYGGWAGDIFISDVKTAEVGDHEIDYFTTATPIPEDSDEPVNQQLLAYMPGPRGRAVLTVLTAKIGQDRPELTDEELLAFLGKVYEGITLETK